MRHIYITLILLFSINLSGVSQKVKYKDLYILLKAENYKDADIYLRSYLINNFDHPNANYQMGKMLQNYMYAEDLMKNGDRAIELADSSQLYFTNALNFITEKDVKKHDDDYYAEFRRRDLRSGKFAVKINDVQLDIETRLEDASMYKEGVVKLNMYFLAATSFYDSCQSNYNIFLDKAESTNVLYFTSGAEELQQLRDLSALYDSSLYNFNTYRAIMKGMSKSTLAQNIEEKSIETYPEDGVSNVDFYAETVEFWNYNKWAKTSLDIIGKQIYPLKKRIVAYDEKLNTLHDTIVKDSLDGRSQIFQLATENVGNDIRDYDATSLPAAIYDYRIAEINYHSAVNYWYKEIIDTTNVGVKVDVLLDFEKQISEISKLLSKLIEVNNPEEKKIFKDYISLRYQDDNGMDEFIEGQINEVLRDSLLLREWVNEVGKQDIVTLWHTDSISLIVGSQFTNQESIRYSTVLVDTLSNRKLGFYAWKEADNSFSLSFSISPSSRMLDTLFNVQINPKLVKQRKLNLQYLSDSLGVEKRVWVLNSTDRGNDSNFTLQVFTTDLCSGLGWNKEFKIKEIPNRINYDHESQRIILLNNNEDTLLLLDENGEEQEVSETNGGGK